MLIQSLRAIAAPDRIIHTSDCTYSDVVAVAGDHADFSFAAEDDGGLVALVANGFMKFSAIVGKTKVEGVLTLTNEYESGRIFSLDVYHYIAFMGDEGWQWHAGYQYGSPTQTDIPIQRSIALRNRLLRMSQRLTRCRAMSPAQLRETLAEILHIIG